MSTAGQAFDPANWQAHYAGVQARIIAAGTRPMPKRPTPQVVIRWRNAPLTEAEAENNEYVYLSGMAVAADQYYATHVEKPNDSAGEYTRRTVKQIILEVSALTGFSYIDIISQRRTAPLALARQFAVWRAKRETPNSYPEIARRFGGRDHSTAIASVRKIDRLVAEGAIPQHWLAACPSWRP